MSSTELLLDLGRLGIRLEADGERLRYFPQSALTPVLLDRLKAHKAELLAMLRPAPEVAPALPTPTSDAPAKPEKAVCRCGSTTWRDVPIHDGQSARRDCGRCGRFLDFPVWYGKDTGHKGQHPV
jgi:TubC N-terminal docking domain